jgi:hypothetical protein
MQEEGSEPQQGSRDEGKAAAAERQVSTRRISLA